MSYCKRTIAFVLLTAASLLPPASANQEWPLRLTSASAKPDLAEGDIAFWIRGVGGVFFLHTGGDFELELFKRERNTFREDTPLYGYLMAPDRTILHRFMIGEDGLSRGEGMGPVQTESCQLKDLAAGIYKLMVIVGNQRSGLDVGWAFRSNAARWVADGGGTQGRLGSKMPLHFLPGGKAGEIWVDPSETQFSVNAKTFKGAVDIEGRPLPLAGGGGRVNRSSVSAGMPVGLLFSSLSGAIEIEGVTTWEGSRDRYYPDIAYWTDRVDHWFDMRALRWALLPHFQLARSDEDGGLRVRLVAHNPTDRELHWNLSYEMGDGVELIDGPMTLSVQPGEEQQVILRFSMDEEGEGFLRCRFTLPDDPQVTSFVTIARDEGRAWEQQRRAVVDIEPYRALGERHGYQPGYPANEFHQHPDGRLFVRDRDTMGDDSEGFHVYEDGEWSLWSIKSVIARDIPGFEKLIGAGAFAPTKVSFDEDGRLYSVYRADLRGKDGSKRSVLLLVYSDGRAAQDNLHAVVVTGLPGGGSVDMEHSVDGRALEQAPVIVVHRQTDQEISRWATNHIIELYFLHWRDGRLVFGEPRIVTSSGVGLAAHSGGGASVVTRDGTTWFTWGETSDPDGRDPGVPTWVAAFDRADQSERMRRIVSYGEPVNDVHNSPALALAADGRLHVVSGAHGRPFRHSHSATPLDPGTWSEAVDVLLEDPVAGPGQQTYLGMVVDDDGEVHIVYRRAMHLPDYYAGETAVPLAYQKFSLADGWSEAQTLVLPPFPSYSVYYHRLSRTRGGALLVSCSYRTAYRTYRSDLPGTLNNQMVLVSTDKGTTWSVLEDQVVDEL